MDPDQAQQNVGPDLDPNCFDTLMGYLKEFFENINYETNSLDLDQARQNVGPDLDLNCFVILMVYLKEIFENINFEINQQTAKKHEKLPSVQNIKETILVFIPPPRRGSYPCISCIYRNFPFVVC